MAVRRGDKWDVQTLAGEVAFRLLEPVGGMLVLALGLEDGDRDRLSAWSWPDAQRVVRAPDGRATRAPIDDLDGPERLLAPDQVLGPASGVEGRVDQLDARLRLIKESPSRQHGRTVAPVPQTVRLANARTT